MEITEFLTERYDESEAMWREADKQGLLLQIPGHEAVWAPSDAPAAMLADVAAKRAIVDNMYAVRLEQPAIRIYREGLAEVTLRMLARPYASHPDYDPAWRL